MAKEILSTGPGDCGEKTGLRSKVADILGTLTKSKEEKKEEINAKNESLMDSFKSGFGKYYYEDGHEYYGDHLYSHDLRYLNMGDTIIFSSSKELRNAKISEMSFIDNFNYFITKNHIKLKIDSYDQDFDDLIHILEHLDLGTYSIGFEFPSRYFDKNGGREAIKSLKKFILKNRSSLDCYFDLGDSVYCGEYGDKNYLKDLITWFTKQGKSGKIQNYVIKANGKEYHSSGDYKYDFE